MTDLVMVHDVVQQAGQGVQDVARRMPAMVCLARGGSGSGGVDGAMSDLERSVEHLLMGAPAALLSVGAAAVRSAEEMSAVDAALAGVLG